MKATYEILEIEIISFDDSDIITASIIYDEDNWEPEEEEK